MKVRIAFVSVMVLSWLSGVAGAQSVVTLRATKDQIAILRTAPGITTRVVFPDKVKEIVCGDLYDPSSGVGSFVIQRGGRDIFLKPVVAKGVSNLFVKLDTDDERVYSFDLLITPVDQAYRIVNVTEAQPQTVPVAVARSVPARPLAMPVIPAIARIDSRIAGSIIGAASFSFYPPASANLTAPPPVEVRSKPAQVGTKALVASRNPSARVPLNSEPIRRVHAPYPDYARPTGATGDVVVEIIVNREGKVASAKALSGSPFLWQAAINAALGWKFSPTKVDGTPVEAVGTIKFTFQRYAASSGAEFRFMTGIGSYSSDTSARRR